jgi:hypothetical protein
MAERHLGNRCPLGGDDRRQQRFVFGRIDPVMAAGQHRDRTACDAGAVRRLIDAARQA